MPSAPDPRPDGVAFLTEALNLARSSRVDLIRAYQKEYDCWLIVFIGQITPSVVTPFEELLNIVEDDANLHILLNTPGGDAETAIRLVQQARARSGSLTIAVPDHAKSAGTLMALGADRILMGPPSDLGPIDPQIFVQAADGSSAFRPAKVIIDALAYAEHAVQDHPETYALHASLLSDLTAVMVAEARSALGHTGALLKLALRNRPDLAEDDNALQQVAADLETPLLEVPQSHGAIISAADATEMGLPAVALSPSDPQWQRIWQLWNRYVAEPELFLLLENESRVFSLNDH